MEIGSHTVLEDTILTSSRRACVFMVEKIGLDYEDYGFKYMENPEQLSDSQRVCFQLVLSHKLC